VNGAREWLIGWDGSQPNGKAWSDSWEPTRNVDPELTKEFRERRRYKVSRSIQVDVSPLDSLVQRSISHAMALEPNDSFGHEHEFPLDTLSLADLANYYLNSVAERFGIPICEAYNPKARYTERGLTLQAQSDIGNFCNFESFLPEGTGVENLRYRLGRKTNFDMSIVGTIRLTFYDNKRTPGLVTFEVKLETCWINGMTGHLQPPHLDKGFLKEESNLLPIRRQARHLTPEQHPLREKGWCALADDVDALADEVAMPDH
jgi:hypothetical protein